MSGDDEVVPVVGVNAQNRGPWMYQVFPYVKNTQAYNCPELGDVMYSGTLTNAKKNQTSYGWNWNLANITAQDGYSLADLPHPSETIILGDTGFIDDSGVIQAGFAMFSTNPKDLTAGADVSTNAGYIVKFRHGFTTTVAVKDGAATRKIPTDGIANFAFLDGHAKAMNPGQAFKIAPGTPPKEDNSPALTASAGTFPGATGNANVWFEYWNRW